MSYTNGCDIQLKDLVALNSLTALELIHDQHCRTHWAPADAVQVGLVLAHKANPPDFPRAAQILSVTAKKLKVPVGGGFDLQSAQAFRKLHQMPQLSFRLAHPLGLFGMCQ